MRSEKGLSPSSLSHMWTKKIHGGMDAANHTKLSDSVRSLQVLHPAEEDFVRMPQSRANSAPCLYCPPGQGASDGSDIYEGLTFNIYNTLTTLRRLMLFLEPVHISCRLVKYILGRKICALLCCAFINVLFLKLSEDGWFLLGLLCAVALAALGFLKRHSRWTATKLALQRKRPCGETEVLPGFHASQQELVLELKALLQELDEVLSQACRSAESTHNLLYWESCGSSALFYGGILAVLFLLYTGPGSYTLVLTNSALFLWKGELHQVVRNIFWRKAKTTEEQKSENRRKKPSPGNAVSDNTILVKRCDRLLNDWGVGLSFEVEDPADPDADYDFKDAIEDDDDEDYDSPLMLRRGALVGVIPTFYQKGQKRGRRRRLHSSSNSGNCSRCQTSFSVLKKKKNCSNCGSSFCTRCCCKVLKSCLDTAVPEDHHRTVFVCTLCSVSLNKQE